MRKFLAEMGWLLVLVWGNRRLGAGRVSDYARTSIGATVMVEAMRRRYPGHDFFWSYPTNHVLDCRPEYVVVWEVLDHRRTRVQLVFKGPLNHMAKMVAEGFLDDRYEVRPGGGAA